ncbi:hypothetical protein CWI75_10325 [Kineobactrum sediminis]|uniref:DUF4412 domain-containing protein n=1 Tax=Kineobactrum sediminis TaxID=1905677 RepID=A0A2N5Y1A9_9GAMM|nr:hypothetical protein [Kineobactrum sediminis]PLW82175.1 hypothetical protein CWI75_10325 [Kineobactrum sediminis]
MLKLMRYALYPTAALGLVLASSLSSADIAQVVDQQGNRTTFEYEGDKLRINSDDQQGYMIMRDRKLYVVTEDQGEFAVIDLSQAMSMFGGFAKAAVPDMTDVRVESLQATGRKETLAGIQGEVYLLKFTDHEGKAQQTEMTLSPDPRALGFRDAINRMATNLAGLLDQQQSSDHLQGQLTSRNLGVLRYGTDMQVSTIDATVVDPARFVLPAEPTDMSGLGKMFGGGGKDSADNSSGGGLSGLFGGNNNSEEETQEKKPSAQDIEEAATKIGNEVGKAFGKLFGN